MEKEWIREVCNRVVTSFPRGELTNDGLLPLPPPPPRFNFLSSTFMPWASASQCKAPLSLIQPSALSTLSARIPRRSLPAHVPTRLRHTGMRGVPFARIAKRRLGCSYNSLNYKCMSQRIVITSYLNTLQLTLISCRRQYLMMHARQVVRHEKAKAIQHRHFPMLWHG